MPGVPVHRHPSVYGLGRTYAAHAAEMGAAPEPVVFVMPWSSLAPGGGEIPWPEGSGLVHHEVELVLRLGAGGRRLERDAAGAAIAAVTVGIDLTARDLQGRAKELGHPWSRAKGFPGACPLGPPVAADPFRGRWGDIDLVLAVDGEIRQRARVAEMRPDPPGIVSLLSRWFELVPGDLVFTGTPAGVGPVRPGERLVASSRALGVRLECALLPP